MVRENKRVRLACASILALTAATAAQAQEMIVLEEIIVTAQRRIENPMDVPLSITAISGDALERAGVGTVDQAMRLIPNVSLDNNNSLRSGRISIRGITSDVNNLGTEGSVAVSVDGVYQGRATTLNSDLIDLERVEVLRGPQGTLYGKNTTGGAINIITRRPAKEPEAVADIRFGNHDAQRYRATVSAPLGDAFAFRASAAVTRRDGLLTNSFQGRKVNDINNETARLTLEAHPSETVTIRLSADGSRDDGTGDSKSVLTLGGTVGGFAQAVGVPLTVPPLFDRTTAFDAPNNENRRVWGTSATIDWDTGEDTVTSISALRGFTFDNQSDNDFTPLSLVQSGLREKQHQFSQELRYVAAQRDHFRYTAGLYYFHQVLKGNQVASVGPHFSVLTGVLTGGALVVPAGSVAPAFVRTETDSYAAYAEGTYDVTEQFSLTAGLRYSHETKDVRHDQSKVNPLFVPLGFPPPIPVFTAGLTENNLSPKLTAQYRFNDDTMAYATVSRGFKGGGFSTGLINSAADTEFKSEKATNYELGLKSTLIPRRLNATLTGFYLDYSDLQVSTFVTNRFIVSNAASATSKGVELELEFKATKELLLQASAGYLDASYDDFANAPCPAGSAARTCDLSGKRMLRAPEWTTTLTADYEREVTAGITGYFRADYTYKSGQFFTLEQDPDLSQSGYGLVGGKAGLRFNDGAYELSVYAQNLFDRHYINGGGTGIPFSDTKGVTLGDPRLWGVEFKARF